MAAFAIAVSTLGVGDLAQVPDRLAQQWRIQPTRRLQQHRFGLGSDLIWQVVGAVGQDPGMGR